MLFNHVQNKLIQKVYKKQMKTIGISKHGDIVKCFTFFSGQVGGWKDHLTVRQSETIDRIFEEKLKGTDIKFTYEL